jgi:hypothetical protein
MNIFVLDLDPKKCAEYHVDSHVSKMNIELAQIMCTVLNEIGYSSPYKTTHTKHPCTLWAKQSLSNYLWLRELSLELHKEFQYRYNKTHKSGIVAKSLPIPNLPDIGLTPFAQAMPDQYRHEDAVTAYRSYYHGEKASFSTWKNGNIPEWFLTKQSP